MNVSVCQDLYNNELSFVIQFACNHAVVSVFKRF